MNTRAHTPQRHRSGLTRGFTLIEMLVAVTTFVVLLTITATLVAGLRQTINVSQSTSAATIQFAALERAIRADLQRVTRDGFMVIRQADVELTYDGVRNTYATDQLLFFTRGSEQQQEQTDRYAWDSTLALPVAHSGTSGESRVWYGHLNNRDLREWHVEDIELGYWPPQSWSMGRHELALIPEVPQGFSEAVPSNINNTGTFTTVAESLATPPLQDIARFYAWPQQLTVRELNGFTYAAAAFTSTAWSDTLIRPSIWNVEAVAGKMTLDRGALDTIWPMTDEITDGQDPLRPLRAPVTAGFGSLAEIKSYLMPQGFDSQINGHLEFHYQQMIDACFRVSGPGGENLAGRAVPTTPNGDVINPNADTPVTGAATPTGTLSPLDEYQALANMVIPHASSFRIEFAGDFNGDGLLDMVPTNAGSADAGQVRWYSINSPYLPIRQAYQGSVATGDWPALESDIGNATRKRDRVVPTLQDLNTSQTDITTAGFLAPQASADFYDIAFGYKDLQDSWPWMLRFTITIRDDAGRHVNTGRDSRRRILREAQLAEETVRANPNVGNDLEATKYQFVVELPR